MMIFSKSRNSGLYVPTRRVVELPARRCPNCGKPRRARAKRIWRDRFRFPIRAAIGDPLVDASGNPIVDSGSPYVDDGAGNDCCCGVCSCCNDSTPTSLRIVISGTTAVSENWPSIDGTYTVSYNAVGSPSPTFPVCGGIFSGTTGCDINTGSGFRWPTSCGWQGYVSFPFGPFEDDPFQCKYSNLIINVQKDCTIPDQSQWTMFAFLCDSDFAGSPCACYEPVFDGSSADTDNGGSGYTTGCNAGPYAIPNTGGRSVNGPAGVATITPI